MFKRVLLTIIGIAFIAIGIAFTIESTIGTGGLDAVHNAISVLLDIQFGYAVILLGLAFLLIMLIDKKEKMLLLTLIPLFLLGTFINISLFFVPSVTNTLQMFLFSITGVIIIGIGGGLSIYANLAPTVVDKFTVWIQEKLNLKTFTQAKLLFEFTCIIIAIIAGIFFLGGVQSIGIGTFIIIFGVGPVVDITMNIIKKIANE